MPDPNSFYPLAKGNQWTYNMADGRSFTNAILSEESPGTFLVSNSMVDTVAQVHRQGSSYLTDSYEQGIMQVVLKDDLKAGESWEIKFKANGYDNILVMTVKEFLASKEVEGKIYNDVVMIESDSKINVNGNIMSINYFTQYYYARGVGAILTTSKAGDYVPLISYELH